MRKTGNMEDLKNWPKENVSFITNIQIIPTIRNLTSLREVCAEAEGGGGGHRFYLQT